MAVSFCLSIPVILSLDGNTEDSRFPKDFLSKLKHVDISYNKNRRKMCLRVAA